MTTQKILHSKRQNIRLIICGLVFVAFVLTSGILIFNKSNHSIQPANAQEAIAENTIMFEDNFNNQKTTGWSIVDETTKNGPSRWSVMSHGVLRQTSNISAGGTPSSAVDNLGTYMVAGNAGWRDYEFSVRIKSTDDDGIGVIFRQKDRNNYYRFMMDRQRNNQRLVKKVNGMYTKLAERSAGYDAGRWYVLKVQVVGSTIKIYVDDMNQPIFEVDDATHTQGQIGLFSWGSQPAYFDDVRVEAVVGSFTVAVLPDTQYYSERFMNPSNPSDPYPKDMFTKQTEWIAKNRAQQKIAFVLHEGDIVNAKTKQYQWDNASRSIAYLDGKVPYVLAAGNHDVDYKNARGDASVLPDSSEMNSYFPVSRIRQTQGLIDTFEPDKIDNAYYYYNAGGVKFMVISLQFAPLDEHLAWANDKIAENPDKKVIILTHDFLEVDGSLRNREKFCPSRVLPRCPSATGSLHQATAPLPGNDGQQIWDKLARKHENIFLVLNGHVAHQTTALGKQSMTGDHGNKVYQILANYQGRSKWNGNALMRLMKFYPSENKIEVKTFSPYANVYLTDSQNQFTLNNISF